MKKQLLSKRVLGALIGTAILGIWLYANWTWISFGVTNSKAASAWASSYSQDANKLLEDKLGKGDGQASR